MICPAVSAKMYPAEILEAIESRKTKCGVSTSVLQGLFSILLLKYLVEAAEVFGELVAY